jgi:hypothetical protein
VVGELGEATALVMTQKKRYRAMDRDTSGRGNETDEAELVGLKDGSSVLIRPVTAADKPLLIAGLWS